jgi:prevent-host-death family protein
MTTVSITELKARLSEYVREVRRGGEVQILDRGTPVARLVGLAVSTGGEGRRRQLVRDGVLRPGEGGALAAVETPAIEVPSGLSGALEADREDRL